MQTIPFYVCENNYGQCITSHADDAEGQRACKKAASNCGSKNASEESTTSSSSSTTAASTTLATATATDDSSASSTSSVAAASTTTSNAAVAGDLTKMSTGLMAGLMFVAARMVL
jgi:hypothetical protein